MFVTSKTSPVSRRFLLFEAATTQSAITFSDPSFFLILFSRDSSVIFLPHLNISDEVLTRLNERTKNARIEIEIKKPVAK